MSHLDLSLSLRNRLDQRTNGHVNAHLTISQVLPLSAVSGVGSSPALATCATSQVLLAGVLGGFPGGTPVSPHPPIGSSRYE